MILHYVPAICERCLSHDAVLIIMILTNEDMKVIGNPCCPHCAPERFSKGFRATERDLGDSDG